jgi:hypothetical protein
MGVTTGDGMQWHTGGLSSTVDSGQFSTLSFEECVVEGSTIDTSNERHAVAPQQDCDQGSRHLTGQFRVSEDMIMAATRCIDDTHALVGGYCWRASIAHDSSDRGLAIDDLHTLIERVILMRADYQWLLMDKYYLLEVGEMYHRALREQEVEVDRLTHELVSTRGFLEGTQTTFQESEARLEELLEETSRRSTISISTESQIYPLVTYIGGLTEEHQWMEEHEEMYLVEHGYSSPLQKNTNLGDHLHRSNSCVSNDGWRMTDPQYVEIPTVLVHLLFLVFQSTVGCRYL